MIDHGVAAPGVNIFSTWLNGGYNTLSGTSMATPMVSGSIALVLSKTSNLRPNGIRNAMESTSNCVQPPCPNVNIGYGRIDALNAVNLFMTTPGGQWTGTLYNPCGPSQNIPCAWNTGQTQLLSLYISALYPFPGYPYADITAGCVQNCGSIPSCNPSGGIEFNCTETTALVYAWNSILWSCDRGCWANFTWGGTTGNGVVVPVTSVPTGAVVEVSWYWEEYSGSTYDEWDLGYGQFG